MKRVFLPLVPLVCFTGCASPKSGSDSVPPDFGLSFTVLRAEGDAKTAWYVMQPDGILRAVAGVRREDTPIPPAVRTLTAEERLALWSIVRDSNWLSDSIPEGFKVASELDAKDVAVSVTGDDRRSTLIGPVGDKRITEMESKLRALAWFDEGL